MSVILRNEHGAIAVNKGVIERMIVEDLLEMSDSLILCSKKGRPIKEKPSRFLDPDYFDAIEVYEKRQEIRVKVFIITIFGMSISDIADKIFAKIETDFELLRIKKPGVISVNVRGIMSDQLIKRNIEVVRRNV
ncbi:MAG: hypothetical protein IJH43_05380 [Mogibacterium sp.]|nr:hypothetical protein [Mogibacterium sp.]